MTCAETAEPIKIQDAVCSVELGDSKNYILVGGLNPLGKRGNLGDMSPIEKYREYPARAKVTR